MKKESSSWNCEIEKRREAKSKFLAIENKTNLFLMQLPTSPYWATRKQINCIINYKFLPHENGRNASCFIIFLSLVNHRSGRNFSGDSQYFGSLWMAWMTNWTIVPLGTSKPPRVTSSSATCGAPMAAASEKKYKTEKWNLK